VDDSLRITADGGEILGDLPVDRSDTCSWLVLDARQQPLEQEGLGPALPFARCQDGEQVVDDVDEPFGLLADIGQDTPTIVGRHVGRRLVEEGEAASDDRQRGPQMV
jgi:hypothetical protein